MLANFLYYTKLFLYMVILSCAVTAIMIPSAPAHLTSVLIGLIGILVVVNTITIDGIRILEGVRRDYKLVQIQDLIIAEIKKNNTQVINLVKNQADLLSKMTEIAVEKTNKSQESPN